MTEWDCRAPCRPGHGGVEEGVQPGIMLEMVVSQDTQRSGHGDDRERDRHLDEDAPP